MNAKASLSFSYDHTAIIAAGLGNNVDHLVRTGSTTWATGTGASQVNVAWHDKRTLAHGGVDTLDLSDLAGLETAWKEDIQFDAIKALLIQNLSSTPADPTPADTITLSTTLANHWRAFFHGTITLRGGSHVMMFCDDDDTTAYAVTAATADLLRVTASVDAGSGSLDYVIALVGIDT